MLWDFNLFLLAGMSPDALGNWIFFWSVLPFALIIGFWVVNDWFKQKLKERRKAAEHEQLVDNPAGDGPEVVIVGRPCRSIHRVHRGKKLASVQGDVPP